VEPRALDFEDWISRQECSDEVREEVAEMIFKSTGSLRAHFNPQEGPPRVFHELDLTLFAIKA
jgi:hypothetical protein